MITDGAAWHDYVMMVARSAHMTPETAPGVTATVRPCGSIVAAVIILATHERRTAQPIHAYTSCRAPQWKRDWVLLTASSVTHAWSERAMLLLVSCPVIKHCPSRCKRRLCPGFLVQPIVCSRRCHFSWVARVAVHPRPVKARIVPWWYRLRDVFLAIKRASFQRKVAQHGCGWLVQWWHAAVFVGEVGAVVCSTLEWTWWHGSVGP